MIRRAIILVIVATAAILGAANAQAAPAFEYDNDLRWWVHNSLEQASIDQGSFTKRIPKEVYVRCYTNKAAFETGLIRRGESYANVPYIIAYYAGGSTINMRAGTCRLAHQFTDAALITQDSAGAFKTLLHEALHRQGYNDEANTELFAITATAAAGQLAEYNRRLSRGAIDEDAAWTGSAYAGRRAMALAHKQMQRYIAYSYRSSWDVVVNVFAGGGDFEGLSWSDWLHRY